MQVQQFHSGNHQVETGLAVGNGDAHIDAEVYTTVILFDKATADGWDNTDITARGDNLVHLYGAAQADVGGTSRLTACDRCRYTVRETARVEASGTSEGFVMDNASILAFGNAKATMMSHGDLKVKGDASVLYAPFGKGICIQVTAQSMSALADALSLAAESCGEGDAEATLTRVIGAIRADLRDGFASRALRMTLDNRRIIESRPPLLAVFQAHRYWPNI